MRLDKYLAETAQCTRSNQQGTAAGLCTGRSNRYLWFRCCTADGHYEVKRPPSESERKEHGFSWKKL